MTVDHGRRRVRLGKGAPPLGGLVVLLGLGVLPCHWAAAPAAAQAPPALDVRISLTEWALTPARLTVPAGRLIRFVASNDGALPHSLAVEGPGIAAESEAIGSNQVTRLDVTFALPGTYDLFCPVNAGQHRALGQEGTLVVLPAPAGVLLPRTGRSADVAAEAGSPESPQ
jgi:plastocyanin